MRNRCTVSCLASNIVHHVRLEIYPWLISGSYLKNLSPPIQLSLVILATPRAGDAGDDGDDGDATDDGEVADVVGCRIYHRTKLHQT